MPRLVYFPSRLARLLRRFLLFAPDHGPALELGDRTMLLDPNDVARAVFIGLVVGVIFLRPPHGLLQHRMGEAAFHAHHHRLLLLVAHHDALERTLRHLYPLTSTSTSRPSSAARPPHASPSAQRQPSVSVPRRAAAGRARPRASAARWS